MKANLKATFAALAVATAFCAARAEDYWEVASPPHSGFNLDTSGRPVAIATQADLAALSAWPVTFRAGETVTATSPDGTAATLASHAAAAGIVAFAPDAGGLWRLENSNGASALVGVSWSVFDDAWEPVSADSSPLRMDTHGTGPDRRTRKRMAPLVAYSGDGWRGGAAASSTLTVTAPDGATASLALVGSDVTPVAFDKPGAWRLALAMSGSGTALESSIDVVEDATVIYMR